MLISDYFYFYPRPPLKQGLEILSPYRPFRTSVSNSCIVRVRTDTIAHNMC